MVSLKRKLELIDSENKRLKSDVSLKLYYHKTVFKKLNFCAYLS